MSRYLEIEAGLTEVARNAIDQHRAYRQFSETVWSEGVLPSKEKELIAVGVAHSTKCHYCITHHTKKAKNEGATLGEVVEAAMVAVPIEGNSYLKEKAWNQISERSNSEDELIDPFLNHDEKLNAFTDVVFKPKHLSARLKYLIAIAICFTNQTPYLLDNLIQKAIKEGASEAELKEAYYISALMKAGGTMTYITDSINAYQSN